jgi:hypothetical protein
VRVDDITLPVANAPVSANFFSVLGAHAASGRLFGSADVRSPVAVVSHRFWSEHFADDSLPGSSATLTIDGTAYSVVGVAPTSFNFPEGVDIWYPEASNPVWAKHDCCFWMVGRMRQQGTVAAFDLHLSSLAKSLHAGGFSVIGLRGRPVRALLGANPLEAVSGLGAAIVGSIALLTILNTALLIFTRVLSQLPEFAVRSALGATRWKLCATLGTRILAVCSAGAVIALGIASCAIVYIVHAAGGLLPPWLPLRIDHVLVLSIACLWATAVLVSASMPIVRLFWGDRALLAATGRGVFGGKQDQRITERLICAEIAIAVSFLCASSVFAFSVAKRLEMSDAVQAGGLYVVGARPPFGLSENVATANLPTDVAVAYDQTAILLGHASVTSEGSSAAFVAHSLRNAARLRAVSSNYLRVGGIRVLSGHSLSDERAGEEPSAVISTTAARMFFGSRNPIGRLLTIDSLDDKTPHLMLRVAGVIGDVRDGAWANSNPPPVIMTTWRPQRPYQLRFYIRSSSESTLRSTVKSISADIPGWSVGSPESLAAARREEVHGLWVPVMVFGPIGILTLMLAVIGVTGLIRFTTARRLKELAIRSALGATNRRLTVFVAKRLLLLAVIAEGIGVIGALVLIAIGGGSDQNAGTVGLVVPLTGSLVGVALCVLAGAVPALRPLWELNASQLLNDVGGGRRS